VQRSVSQLRNALSEWEHWAAEFRMLALEPRQIDLIQSLEAARVPPAGNMAYQQEDEMLEWLEDHSLDRSWELAPVLVSTGWSLSNLEQLEQSLVPAQFAVVIPWIVARSSVHELLDEVKLGATQVSELVKAVKAYSYLDQGPLQTVDLHESLDNTLVMLQYKIKTGVSITREYGTDIPCVQARGSQLNQVWTNLVDNAIDAMEGQGNITIRTSRQKSGVVVEIIDTGPGIPANVQPHIFEPFFTTKGPGSGSGLGLYIVYDIVHKQGGQIHVNSNPGGTEFRVTLPLDLARDPVKAPPA
jgi:signal transduction histidine kinase